MNKIELIKNDEYLNKIIKDNNLSDSFIDNNINVFLRVLNSRNKCQNCNGLFCCSQESVGQKLSLSYQEVLVEEIEYCDYKLASINQDKIINSYVYSDIPKKFINVNLHNIKITDDQKGLFLKLSEILLKKSYKGLYITGNLGVGKTYLCMALANSLVKNNEKVAFVKVNDFINELKIYVSNDSKILDNYINKLKKVTYLFMDDIGAEAVSSFVRDDLLFRILDYRLENNLTTIFTSNLNKEDLLKHYTYDRKDNSNAMKARRLLERIDILTDDYVLVGQNMRRSND